MKCSKCDFDNNIGVEYCDGCGARLEDVAQVVDSAVVSSDDNSLVLDPVLPVDLILEHDGKEFPLVKGKEILIARNGTTLCVPDIAPKSDTVSSTPVKVVERDGRFYLQDTGTPYGTGLYVLIPPGGEHEIQPGFIIMPGDEIIQVK